MTEVRPSDMVLKLQCPTLYKYAARGDDPYVPCYFRSVGVLISIVYGVLVGLNTAEQLQPVLPTMHVEAIPAPHGLAAVKETAAPEMHRSRPNILN